MIVRQRRPTDNGLLERIENDRNPSQSDMRSLISRVADILERNDYLNDCFEDETYMAFDALDKLWGKMSDHLYEDQTGITAEKQRENTIRDRHDYNRKSEAA